MTRARNSANLASDGNLFVDITNDRTGIGSVVPEQNLHVAGTAGFHADTTFVGDLYNTTWDRSDNSLKFVDNAKAKFGTGGDLEIFHDGSHSRITDAGTGALIVSTSKFQINNAAGNEVQAFFLQNGTSALYFDNSKKFETTAYGTNTTGTAVNDGLVVAGVATVTTMNVTGVLTYDDVTSVDSVGIVTARQGIHIDDSIVHIGDTNTKIRFPANDQVSIETAGSERLNVSASQFRVLTNIGAGDFVSHYNNTSLGIKFYDASGSSKFLGLAAEDSGTSQNHATFKIFRQGSSVNRAYIDGSGNFGIEGKLKIADIIEHAHDSNTSIRFPANDTITFNTNNAERLRIDSNGNIGVNVTPATSGTLYNTVDHFLVIGDNDTGIAQDGDGQFEIWANNAEIANFNTGGITFTKALSITGNTSTTGNLTAGGNSDITGTLTVGGVTRVGNSSGSLGINCTPSTSGGFGSNTSKFAIGDNDTGLAQISDGILAFYTNNAEVFRINGTKKFIIGTTTEGNSSADDLTIATSSDTGITIRSGTSSGGNIYFSDGTSGADEYRGVISYDHASNFMRFYTNAAERFRITSDGKLLINSSTVTASYGGKLQLTNSNFAMNSFANNPHAQTFLFAKSRGTSGSGGTIVQDNDFCGHIEWYADDGVDTQNQIAKISGRIDGTPGANDTPGELLFYTTADGANASTERLRIASDGKIGIGNFSSITQSRKVHIHEASSAAVYATFTNSTTGTAASNGFTLGIDSSEHAIFNNYSNTDIVTICNGGERLRIHSDGKISTGGITNPTGVFCVDTGTGTTQANTLELRRDGSNDYHAVSFFTGTTVDWSVGQNSLNAFEVYENGAASSTRLTILNGGNFGIGTRTPLANLHVNDQSNNGEGTIKIGGNTNSTTTGATLFYEISGSTYLRIKNLYRSNSSNGNNAYIEYDGGYHKFMSGTGGTERLRIASDGKIGVNTPSPIGTLDVYDGTFVLSKPNASGNERNWRFVNNNVAAGNLGLQVSTAAGGSTFSNLIEITRNGYIGINEGTPDRRIHLKDPAQIKLESTGTGNWSGLEFMASSGTNNYDAYMGMNDSDGVFFIDNDSDGHDFTIDRSRNITLGRDYSNNPSNVLTGVTIVRGHCVNTGTTDNDFAQLYLKNSSSSGNSSASIRGYREDSNYNTGLRFYTHNHPSQGGDGAERMRIDSTGRVLIGTTENVVSKLYVSGGSLSLTGSDSNFGGGGNRVFLDHDNNDVRFGFTGGGGSNTTKGIRFYHVNNHNGTTNNNRITQFGEFRICHGAGSDSAVSTDFVNGIGDASLDTVQSNLARLVMQERVSHWISFKTGGGTHYGSIVRSGSGVSYGSNSDYRLKDNVADLTGGIALVKQLRPVTFNWNDLSGLSKTETHQGFIAHEVQALLPDAVSGEKDGVEIWGDCTDSEGNVTQTHVPESKKKDGETWAKVGESIEDQQLDTGKLIPILTKALQEAIAKIETLETKVTALEEK